MKYILQVKINKIKSKKHMVSFYMQWLNKVMTVGVITLQLQIKRHVVLECNGLQEVHVNNISFNVQLVQRFT